MVLAGEAVGQLAGVVAGERVVEAGRTFEHRLATADGSLLRQSDGEHRVAHRGAFAQRAALEVAASQIGAQRDHRVHLVGVEAHDLCGRDGGAEDAEHRPGVKAARHDGRNPVRRHALHHFVARGDGGDERRVPTRVRSRPRREQPGMIAVPGCVSMRKVSHLPPANIISAFANAAPPLVTFAPDTMIVAAVA